MSNRKNKSQDEKRLSADLPFDLAQGGVYFSDYQTFYVLFNTKHIVNYNNKHIFQVNITLRDFF